MLLSSGFFLNIIFSTIALRTIALTPTAPGCTAGIDWEEAEETDEEEKPEHHTEAVTVLGTLRVAARTEAFIARGRKSVRSVRCHNMILLGPACDSVTRDSHADCSCAEQSYTISTFTFYWGFLHFLSWSYPDTMKNHRKAKNMIVIEIISKFKWPQL